MTFSRYQNVRFKSNNAHTHTHVCVSIHSAFLKSVTRKELLRNYLQMRVLNSAQMGDAITNPRMLLYTLRAHIKLREALKRGGGV